MSRYLLREKFRAHPDALHDGEVASLVGVRLPSGPQSIGKYMDMTTDELEVAGLSHEDAVAMRAVKELAIRYLAGRMAKKDLISSPRAVIDFARAKIGGLPHEAFMAIFTTVQNEVVAHEIINQGTVDQVAVYPRRIIEAALKYHAAGLVLVHNHPSGYISPSEEDKQLTKIIKDGAKIMDIRVLDHIIVGRPQQDIGNKNYFSFLEAGLL